MFKHQSKGDGGLAKDVDLEKEWRRGVADVLERTDAHEMVADQ